jgi:RecB family exonuclease
MRFLENLANLLIQHHGHDLSDVTVVLPTQRSRLFLNRYLFLAAGKNIWAPRFYILPELVAECHGGRTGNEIEMLTGLYDVYLNVSKSPEPFASFIRWAPVAMRDFRDIDASLATPKAVFSDLRNIREIEEWSFQSEELSVSQKVYLQFWSELGQLYEAFALWQDEHKMWNYQRMLRRLCEGTSELVIADLSPHIYVAGISAFSPAEETWLKKLGKNANLYVHWDIDAYYAMDAMHEAGANYRKSIFHMRKDDIPSNIQSHAINVHVHESGTAVSQVIAAASILKTLSPLELNDACVVLSDESLSEAFLSALGSTEVPVNLALGLPAGRFVHARIVRSVLRIRVSRMNNPRGIYHNDLVGFLHLLVEAGLGATQVGMLLQRLVEDVRVFTDDGYLKRKSMDLDELTEAIACICHQDETALLSIYAFIEKIGATGEVDGIAKDKILGALNDLSELVANRSYLNEPESLLALFEHVIAKISVHYQGEPVNGLQILNMVETRALDFSTVFVLGANDDIFPGNQFDQSFIPFDLRAYYKLTMPDVKDATYAHTFYRLLHHASVMHLFYSSVSPDFKGVEQSRYITQIEQELSALSKQVVISRSTVRTPQGRAFRQSVHNNEVIRQRLKELLGAGLSPSAINKFIACPLDFYFRYVAGLGEEERVEERMTDATFGSVVHLVLEKFYEKFLGSYPGMKDFDDLESHLEQKIDEAIEENYSTSNASSGENLLLRMLASKMLHQYISNERQRMNSEPDYAAREVIGVEEILSKEIDSQVHGLGFPVAVRGKSDRIDRHHSTIEIIDYKTGKIHADKLKLPKTFEELFTDTKYSKALQLMLYIYMYEPLNQSGKIKAGIYSMVNHQGGYMFLDPGTDNTDPALIQTFETELVNWIKSLYGSEVFEHNPDSRFCEYCY